MTNVAKAWADNPCVRLVDSFEALIGERFRGSVNALCWPRRLPGDFAEIVERLAPGEGGIHTIAAEDLRALTLSPAGAAARAVLLSDQALLGEHGLAPSLDCVTGHARPPSPGPVPTDIYSFHVDSAPIPADTYLCTYTGAATEGLVTAAAARRLDDPQTRARLLADYGGADDDGFAAYASERFFDLHYTARPGATPYSFGQGHLWRIAIAYPDAAVAPCVHRAPLTLPGMPPRLLLIS